MAYDFLGLVNDVAKRVNEVPLTTSNFNTDTGHYGAIKEAINAAVRQINYEQFEWPFNHVTQEDVLSVGETRYPLNPDCKTVDMDSFRIKGSAALGNDTQRLTRMVYEEYLDKYVGQEYNYSTGDLGIPKAVFRTPDMSYGLVPPPDKAYTVVYEYYSLPADLVLATDVPTIPEQFRNVIVDGAMGHVYLFRGNSQDSVLMMQKFSAGIGQMRTLYINRMPYIRSTMIERAGGAGNFVRVK